ncbi:MAG TPA: hypothetical protein VJ180_10855, partial [Pyrinomonadaceae bacterium]|nr:hypothetical protein [Pyrinomonadaceae bacterium]
MPLKATSHARCAYILSLLFACVSAVAFSIFTVEAADGDLDPTFGNGGKVSTDFDGGSDQVNAIALQSDGKLLAAGSSINVQAGGQNFALARYDSTGILDPTFGTGGKVSTDFDRGTDASQAIALMSDGRIVLAGRADQSNNGGLNFALARYASNGTPDQTFGVGGKITTDFDGLTDGASKVLLQPDGKILAGGFAAQSGGGTNFALVRYNINGDLDQNFGV